MTDASLSGTSEDIVVTPNHRVSCNGGGGPLGHPKVYLEMGADGEVICGYCGRRYILKNGPVDPNRY